ncbi:hypothetical protein NHX12_029373, partial [Muraenolepis orangiensis]
QYFHAGGRGLKRTMLDSMHGGMGIRTSASEKARPDRASGVQNAVVMAVNDMKWKTSGTFRPFVEVSLAGPFLSDKKRKFATKSKNNSFTATFNEAFQFSLGKDSSDCYELQVSVKDYCFGRADRLVGTAVVQLRDLAGRRTAVFWCPLGPLVHMDPAGRTLVRLLARRGADDPAREFVKLKSEARPAEEGR